MSAANQAANNRTERLVDAIRQENTAAAEALLAADDVTAWINCRLVSPHNNSEFMTCLHFACLNGHVTIVRLLLARGADVTALDYHSWTPLHHACSSGVDADAKVECLLQHGAASQVKARDNLGETALHKATRCGRSHSVKVLLQHGALVDAECNRGGTALFQACAHGNVACLHELVKHGADLEARHKGVGLTPLQTAAYRGHINCVAGLLDYGADINASDPLKSTALFHAVYMSHVDIIATLLAHAHCDVTIKNTRGKTAFDFASSREVKTLLLRRNVPSSRRA